MPALGDQRGVRDALPPSIFRGDMWRVHHGEGDVPRLPPDAGEDEPDGVSRRLAQVVGRRPAFRGETCVVYALCVGHNAGGLRSVRPPARRGAQAASRGGGVNLDPDRGAGAAGVLGHGASEWFGGAGEEFYKSVGGAGAVGGGECGGVAGGGGTGRG